MGRYKIKFSKSATKQYLNLPLNYKQIVDNTLKKFQDRIPVDIKPIKSTENCYRIRIGRYRILLFKEDDNVLISEIDTRSNVY